MKMKRILSVAGAILLPLPGAILVNKLVSPIHAGGAFLHNIVPIIVGMAIGIACILCFPATKARKGILTTTYIVLYPLFTIGLLFFL